MAIAVDGNFGRRAGRRIVFCPIGNITKNIVDNIQNPVIKFVENVEME